MAATSVYKGELLAAGSRVTLELQPTVRQLDDQIEIDASTTVDQRQLGMTWSPLGIARTPAALTVHAQLRPHAMNSTRAIGPLPEHHRTPVTVRVPEVPHLPRTLAGGGRRRMSSARRRALARTVRNRPFPQSPHGNS